jgi:F0F1-type ATP synthase membrane subunit c/vacuolar-type H+-ATPase subunit K
MKAHRNALGDLLYSEAKHEEEMAKLSALNAIANKPATTNTLIYIIPVAALVIFGVIFAIVLKKKK